MTSSTTSISVSDAIAQAGVDPASAMKAIKRFADIDRNNSGTIDSAEFSRVLQVDPAPLSDGQVDALFRLFDRDGSGFIDMSVRGQVDKLASVFVN